MFWLRNIFTTAACTQVHDFFMKEYRMNPDHTAPNGAVWAVFILFAILATKEHKQTRGAEYKVVTGELVL